MQKQEFLQHLDLLDTVLRRNFSSDTALPGTDYTVASAGHCAAAAAIAWASLGGQLVSARVAGSSHWFNRVNLDGRYFDFDLTGDQFGRPPLQMEPAENLYPNTRVRSALELNEETLQRALRLAQRSRRHAAAEKLARLLDERSRHEPPASEHDRAQAAMAG